MKVRYVVLYVNDADVCRNFWVEQVGMVEKSRNDVAGTALVQVGFEDQEFAFELVPMSLMQDNPDNLDLATPSIAFLVDNLQASHDALAGAGVQVSDIAEHSGTSRVAVADPEDHWFAVTEWHAGD